ncbi:hypothetical protein X740_11010 [Mesorhizobium sp. LNHC221B00]|nr:hypothetical protein X740_11010 [Mesorhizobium sp. LNHC221B00]
MPLKLFDEILTLRERNASHKEEAECVKAKRPAAGTLMLTATAAPAW